MSNVIQFPTPLNLEKELPGIRADGALTEFIECAISGGLIVDCSVISKDIAFDDEYQIYRTTFQLPNHKRKTYIDMPGSQLKTFLLGILLAETILRQKSDDEVQP